jgi:hypothetical protein
VVQNGVDGIQFRGVVPARKRETEEEGESMTKKDADADRRNVYL